MSFIFSFFVPFSSISTKTTYQKKQDKIKEDNTCYHLRKKFILFYLFHTKNLDSFSTVDVLGELEKLKNEDTDEQQRGEKIQIIANKTKINKNLIKAMEEELYMRSENENVMKIINYAYLENKKDFSYENFQKIIEEKHQTTIKEKCFKEKDISEEMVQEIKISMKTLSRESFKNFVEYNIPLKNYIKARFDLYDENKIKK